MDNFQKVSNELDRCNDLLEDRGLNVELQLALLSCNLQREQVVALRRMAEAVGHLSKLVPPESFRH